jgi:predicted metal-dependent hydrolase
VNPGKEVIMAAPKRIPVRNLQFLLGEDVPRYWHGGRRSVTLFFDNLSTFFPAGERFFIRSVAHYRDRIEDPELLAQVRAFSAQEGMHTREHLRYNGMLRDQGHPIDELEARVEAVLDRAMRTAPRRRQLAATCALEHLTASLAHVVLSDPRLLEGAHPALAGLWRWHAVEETEHKAVAFDVYEQVGGTYAERVSTMIVTTFIFLTMVLENQVSLMARDGTVASPREWLSLLRFLIVEPGGLTAALPQWLRYLKPDFHPWQHDNHELALRVESELEGAGLAHAT